MDNKEYIVSLNVSFTTPVSVTAKSDSEAESKGKVQFKKLFKEFNTKLDDIADFEVDLDFVEADD